MYEEKNESTPPPPPPLKMEAMLGGPWSSPGIFWKKWVNLVHSMALFSLHNFANFEVNYFLN